MNCLELIVNDGEANEQRHHVIRMNVLLELAKALVNSSDRRRNVARLPDRSPRWSDVDLSIPEFARPREGLANTLHQTAMDIRDQAPTYWKLRCYGEAVPEGTYVICNFTRVGIIRLLFAGLEEKKAAIRCLRPLDAA